MNEMTHFSDGKPVPLTFTFEFPEGMKWEKDMTREDLLRVIQYLITECDELRQSRLRDFSYLTKER